MLAGGHTFDIDVSISSLRNNHGPIHDVIIPIKGNRMNSIARVYRTVLMLLLFMPVLRAQGEEGRKVPPGQRIYGCSHSFHMFVSDLLAEMAAGAGIKGHVKAGQSMIGGSRVSQFWDAPEGKYPVKADLSAGKVDVLMLSPIWLPDDGIANFAKLAAQSKADTRVTMQEFWLPNDEFVPVYPLQTGKKVDHDAATVAKLTEEQNKYDQVMDDHVRKINKDLGRDVIIVVPVGKAVIALREKIIAGQAPGVKTQAELFSDSWGHPTIPIRVLDAYCHFAVVYKISPVGLPMPKELASAKTTAWRDEKLNRLLQELAWDAVTHHPLSGVKSDAKTKK